jgi:hypothetical protein
MKKALPLLLVFVSLCRLAGCIGQVGGSRTPPGGQAGTGGQAGIDTGVLAADGLPCNIQALLTSRCASCHGAVRSGGAPMSLVTYADLMAPARSNPALTNAQVALARMQNTAIPMPPVPAAHASATEIAAMQSWSDTGFPMGTCGASGTGGSAGAGSGGRPGTGTGGAPDAGPTGLPCDVQAILSSHCVNCHGAVPSGGAPMSLVTYADLMAPSRSNPSMTNADVAIARMQDATAPMPPAPAARATSSEITTMQTWRSGGYAKGTCGSVSPDGGMPTGTGGMGGPPGTGGSPGRDAGAGAGLPCDVQSVMSTRCTTCHGSTPSQGAPMPLVTYADLTAPSRSNPSLTNAQAAVARMQSSTSPMPPAPASRATSSEITTVQSWISAGYPAGSCGGADGGTGDGGVVSDPFKAPATCTSKQMWSGGNNGSSSMNPGRACIDCHSGSDEAPSFSVAGTVYPTAHEPDLCNGFGGSGAQVVIVGADGRTTTLTPNSAGNFFATGSIALPFQAKVVYQGRERVMVAKQTIGDCNRCHTQSGSMSAPGRILLP